MQIREVSVSSVPEYLEATLQTLRDWAEKIRNSPGFDSDEHLDVWYRGQSRSSHKLIPGAYRRQVDHCSAFNRFVAAGAGTIVPIPSTQWEWYFIAQHYELPTRLLDWTEDPLVALYFALIGMASDDDKLAFEDADPPVVWMMDAGSLNYLCFERDCVFVPQDDGPLTKHWLPRQVKDEVTHFEYDGRKQNNDCPIAIWPTRTSPRILAQSGCFTVHGCSKEPLESAFERSNVSVHSELILKVKLAKPETMASELFQLSITRQRYFPELSNVASRLRRLYSPGQSRR